MLASKEMACESKRIMQRTYLPHQSACITSVEPKCMRVKMIARLTVIVSVAKSCPTCTRGTKKVSSKMEQMIISKRKISSPYIAMVAVGIVAGRRALKIVSILLKRHISTTRTLCQTGTLDRLASRRERSTRLEKAPPIATINYPATV